MHMLRLGASATLAGPPVACTERSMHTPLVLAVDHNYPDVVAHLWRRDDVRADASSVHRALRSAAHVKQRIPCLRVITTPQPSFGPSAVRDLLEDEFVLHFCCLHANAEGVRLVLACGVRCTTQEPVFGKMPLHNACGNQAKKEERAEIVKMLVGAGALHVFVSENDAGIKLVLQEATYYQLQECLRLLHEGLRTRGTALCSSY